MAAQVWDLIVIGGGPAGCAFAQTLVNAGSAARVLMLDRAQYPRDKSCGDALTHVSVPLLHEIFAELYASGMPLEAIGPALEARVLDFLGARCKLSLTAALFTVPCVLPRPIASAYTALLPLAYRAGNRLRQAVAG